MTSATRAAIAGRWLAAAAVCVAVALPVRAQEPLKVPEELAPNVKEAIERAKRHILGSYVFNGGGEGSLSAYALAKVGMPIETPAIQTQIRRVQEKIDGGAYGSNREPSYHVYEAACDAMLLADTDPEGNAGRLEALRDYLVRKQLANGGWYYPAVPGPNSGDTSITQFALLGLWAVHRSNIPVPRDTFAKAARWFIESQRNDGGFAYHPFDASGNPEDVMTTESMTAAGCGSLALLRMLLDGPQARPQETPAAPPRRKFGVLEQAVVEGDKPEKSATKLAAGTISVSRDVIDRTLTRAETRLAAGFPDGTKRKFPIYFLYACERTATLLGTETLGPHRWYDAGVEFLLARQQAGGDFGSGVPDTAFAILFLSRATRTLVKPIIREKMVGGGLLVGGRGLPDELDQVDVRKGGAKKRLKKGPVDDLLGQLEQPQEISLPTIQEAIVESVSLENPEELVGQLDRLRRLAEHPKAEVRQVAVWAIARSGDYRMAPVLIARLSDPDPVVAWEASLGLCVLSHMPLGVVPPNGKEPLPIAPPDVSSDDPAARAAYRQWHDQVKAAWDAWYLRVRPYDERDDRRQLPRK